MGCSTSKKSDVVGHKSPKRADAGQQAKETAISKDQVVKEDPDQPSTQRACFGAGCYWGTEHFFYHKFGKTSRNGSIVRGEVGFMGPQSAPANPTYQQVKAGKTEHIEVYDFEYTGGTLYYGDLCRYFFQFHDPTTSRRQGEDRGLQYSSVIFCYSDEQEEIARGVLKELQDLLDDGELQGVYEERVVRTEIRRATKFYPAHLEHQEYLTKNPDGECNHRIRFKEWPGRVVSSGDVQQITKSIVVDNTITAPSVYSLHTMPKVGSVESSGSGASSTYLNLPTSGATQVCFGAGCYWGTEKYFHHKFSEMSSEVGKITSGSVGFMGPADAPASPTYRQVCTGTTGHVEVYHCEYTGGNRYFEEMVRFFFQFHDPTTKKRQGNDVGTQYSSVIYCYDQVQANTALRVMKELQQLMDNGKLTCYEGDKIVTEIRAATTFYPAHKEHQDYLTLNPEGYCNHRMRFNQWPSVDEGDEEVVNVDSVGVEFEEKSQELSTLSTVLEGEPDAADADAANSDASSLTPTAAVATADAEPHDETKSAVDGASDLQSACFGAGCYWGTEKFFFNTFRPSMTSAGDITKGEVGFMGPEGAPANPTYREVCSGSTGHVEVYNCQFIGGAAYYEGMVRYFFMFHDPTMKDRQGNDMGMQYASVIFCYNEQQVEIATRVKQELQSLLDAGTLACYSGETVVTDIRRATTFYPAHIEHQQYLELNPSGYCNHRLRFKAWPSASDSSNQ